jgi:redox-sensitive bicupin YhaK (pirin superfamily)
MRNTNLSPAVKAAPTRQIAYRTRGERRGPLTRLVNAHDIAEQIKPFVLLDYFDVEAVEAPRFKIHPHSGIATVTLLLNGSLEYEDTIGATGLLPAGGVEWMRAGGGVWHTGHAVGGTRLHGFQLWVALPPELENAEAQAQYVPPADVSQEGPARVVLGRHGKARSPVRSPESMLYLHVTLKDGESWRYEPPANHTVAWLFPYTGRLETSEEIDTGELVVFEASSGPLDFRARGETRFVLGSAIKHPHDLVLGYYSVHTSLQALDKGEAEIFRIGARLRTAGRIDEADIDRIQGQMQAERKLRGHV